MSEARDIIRLPAMPLTMRQIAEDVAARYDLTLQDLRRDTRQKYIVRPRQAAMAEMYATGRYSNAQIAGFFGLTDHTTVVHARKAHAQRQGEGA